MWKYRRSFKCYFRKCYGPIVTDQTQWKMRFFECHHLSKYVVDHRFRVNGGRFKNLSWNIFLGDVFISLGNSIKIMTRSLLVASFKIFSFSSLKEVILIVFYDSNMSSLIYFLMHVHIRPKAMAAYIGGVEDTCKVFPSAATKWVETHSEGAFLFSWTCVAIDKTRETLYYRKLKRYLVNKRGF